MTAPMKATARPTKSFSAEFKRRLKSETFSFMGLSLSLIVLTLNLLTGVFIPRHGTEIVDNVLVQSTEISIAFWMFTAGLLLLCLLFLYFFTKPHLFSSK